MTMETEDELDLRRERSPSFPYLDLSTSLDLLKRLLVAAKASEVRISDLATFWGTTPTSGSLTRYVAALASYGLIESSGSGSARKVKVSDTGKRILQDSRPGVKEELCAEAALKPRIMSEIFDSWGLERPDDSIAKSQLQFDHRFTQDAARRLLTVYDANLAHLQLSEKIKDIVALSPSDEEVEKGVEALASSAVRGPTPPQSATHSSHHRRDVFTLEEGDVTLTMPVSIGKASFEDFSDWLDLIKRKVQRGVKSDGEL